MKKTGFGFLPKNITPAGDTVAALAVDIVRTYQSIKEQVPL
jgi:hypothetical protein